jgi:hypothetical protein
MKLILLLVLVYSRMTQGLRERWVSGMNFLGYSNESTLDRHNLLLRSLDSLDPAVIGLINLSMLQNGSVVLVGLLNCF